MANVVASYLCYKAEEPVPYNVLCLKGDEQYIIRMWKMGHTADEDSVSDTADVANKKLNLLLRAFASYKRM